MGAGALKRPPLPARGSVAARPRQLGHPQFAFVRAWAEGVDLPLAWHRYMYVEGAGDGRRARGELVRLLDELRALARAHGRPDVASVLGRDPDAIANRGAAGPSLEAFAATLPADFYSESELVELYRQTHGGGGAQERSQRRRHRLRQRLVDAIQWLEQVGARAPRPEDRVDAWLDERVAARLAVVGIRSLAELRAWIRLKGHRWHQGVPRVGPEGAARIVRWLQEHASSLGGLPERAFVPRRELSPATLEPVPVFGVVPLERLLVPASFDGSKGSNRAVGERCRIAAANDYEAIQAWLRLRLRSTHTWRAYRKEAERFLLWSVVERRKPLSSLDGDDCVAYRDFLAAPGVLWVGSRGIERWSEAWRPFEGPLSVRSQAMAITVVRSLCEWLVRRRYLDSNPWDDVPQRPDPPSMPAVRSLSQRHWKLVCDWLDAQPDTPSSARQRFIVEFGYYTGMRRAELAAAHLGWVRREVLDDGEPSWGILVLGKRSKWREVPLPDPAVEALVRYLGRRGLDLGVLESDPQAPLVARLEGEGPLGASRIYEIVSGAFDRCAGEVYSFDRTAAERIRAATTHWLRHTYGSHAIARGVPQDVLQANLGHASLATTSIYVTAEKSRRHRATRAAFAGRAGGVET